MDDWYLGPCLHSAAHSAGALEPTFRFLTKYNEERCADLHLGNSQDVKGKRGSIRRAQGSVEINCNGSIHDINTNEKWTAKITIKDNVS